MIDRSQVPAGRAIVRLIWVYKRKRSEPLKPACASRAALRSKASITIKRFAQQLAPLLCGSSLLSPRAPACASALGLCGC
eukprot:721956-Pleurochrysis_carterae.AAC.1